MKHYSVVKFKAKEFAEERKAPVYIAKANKKEAYKIEFEEKTTPNYKIIEKVMPGGKEKAQ